MVDVSVVPRSSMTVDEICHELQYMRGGKKRPGTNRDLIYQMARAGTFPPPIGRPADGSLCPDDIPVCRWRWSRVKVQRFIDGEWTPAAKAAT